jgi:hypothetical protein
MVEGVEFVVYRRNENLFHVDRDDRPAASIFYKRIIRKQEAQTVVHISSALEKKL